MVSYASILSRPAAIAGREWGSDISRLLRDCLFLQSKSAFVYGVSGRISKMSAPTASASVSATFAVTPLAEKYATSFLLIPSCLHHHRFLRRKEHLCVPLIYHELPLYAIDKAAHSRRKSRLWTAFASFLPGRMRGRAVISPAAQYISAGLPPGSSARPSPAPPSAS